MATTEDSEFFTLDGFIVCLQQQQAELQRQGINTATLAVRLSAYGGGEEGPVAHVVYDDGTAYDEPQVPAVMIEPGAWFA